MNSKKTTLERLVSVTEQSEQFHGILDVIWFPTDAMPTIFVSYIPPTSFVKLLCLSKIILKCTLDIMGDPLVLDSMLNVRASYMTKEDFLTLGTTIRESSFPLSTFLLQFYVNMFITGDDSMKITVYVNTIRTDYGVFIEVRSDERNPYS